VAVMILGVEAPFHTFKQPVSNLRIRKKAIQQNNDTVSRAFKAFEENADSQELPPQRNPTKEEQIQAKSVDPRDHIATIYPHAMIWMEAARKHASIC